MARLRIYKRFIHPRNKHRLVALTICNCKHFLLENYNNFYTTSTVLLVLDQYEKGVFENLPPAPAAVFAGTSSHLHKIGKQNSEKGNKVSFFFINLYSFCKLSGQQTPTADEKSATSKFLYSRYF